MPIYTEKDKHWQELQNYVHNGYVCGDCGAFLTLCAGGSYGYKGMILRCTRDINHSKLARPFELSPANTPGFVLYDAGKKRRKDMEDKYGTENIKAVSKYEGVVSLNNIQAKEILEAIWPEAPTPEKQRAAILCASYGLNPLMKHIFLIPFNKGKPNESWTTVMGINATRLLASRRGSFSYIENTPRVMTQEEQQRTFGEYDAKKLWAVVKVKDPQTGAEAIGYGWWAKESEPYGTDKGNTKFNMASNRAERQALSRLRPGEMPTGIEIMDEALAEEASREGIIDAEFKEVKDEKAAAVKEHWCPIHNVEFFKKGKMKWYSHSYKGENGEDKWCNEKDVLKLQAATQKANGTNQDDNSNGGSNAAGNTTSKDYKRDPASVLTIDALQKALKEDYGLDLQQQLNELNLKYWTDLTLKPSEAYIYVADTRQ